MKTVFAVLASLVLLSQEARAATYYLRNGVVVAEEGSAPTKRVQVQECTYDQFGNKTSCQMVWRDVPDEVAVAQTVSLIPPPPSVVGVDYVDADPPKVVQVTVAPKVAAVLNANGNDCPTCAKTTTAGVTFNRPVLFPATHDALTTFQATRPRLLHRPLFSGRLLGLFRGSSGTCGCGCGLAGCSCGR